MLIILSPRVNHSITLKNLSIFFHEYPEDRSIMKSKLIYQIFASSLAPFYPRKQIFFSSLITESTLFFPWTNSSKAFSRRGVLLGAFLIEQRKLNGSGRIEDSAEHIKFDGIVSLAGEKWFKGKSGGL